MQEKERPRLGLGPEQIDVCMPNSSSFLPSQKFVPIGPCHFNCLVYVQWWKHTNESALVLRSSNNLHVCALHFLNKSNVWYRSRNFPWITIYSESFYVCSCICYSHIVKLIATEGEVAINLPSSRSRRNESPCKVRALS